MTEFKLGVILFIIYLLGDNMAQEETNLVLVSNTSITPKLEEKIEQINETVEEIYYLSHLMERVIDAYKIIEEFEPRISSSKEEIHVLEQNGVDIDKFLSELDSRLLTTPKRRFLKRASIKFEIDLHEKQSYEVGESVFNAKKRLSREEVALRFAYSVINDFEHPHILKLRYNELVNAYNKTLVQISELAKFKDTEILTNTTPLNQIKPFRLKTIESEGESEM